MVSRRPRLFNRIHVLLFFFGFFFIAIVLQMINLQFFKSSYFRAKAEEGHLGYSEVQARRGDIMIKDPHSGEYFRLATNISQPTLFADPTLIEDPGYVTDKLADLIFDLDEAQERDAYRIRQLKRTLAADVTEEERGMLQPRTEEELKVEFRQNFFEKISQKTRQSIILYQDPPVEMRALLKEKNLPGIQVSESSIIAYPAQIGDRDYVAQVLAPVVEISNERLAELLVGRNRYVVLRDRIPSALEEEIRAMMKEDKDAGRKQYAGINFQDRTYRYYPEGELASQVIGFTAQSGGVYGIEQSFDLTLRGKKGIFKTQLDAIGQQVIVGDDLVIEPAIDGDSVVLTIDRSIQMKVEQLLGKAVRDSRADSGLVLIMEPKTGKIISMAHYPTFDPNDFSDALVTEDINLSAEELERITTVGEPGNETHYLNIDYDSHYRIQIFKTLIDTGRTIYSKFQNILGSGVYRNRAVSDIWEPGSIFKTVAMSIALDDGDVTPNTTFNDTGPIKVDEFEIHNAVNTYHGITTMRQVLEQSLNTGMAFVARKMGRELFGSYLGKFGFGERTDIEFENEHAGQFKDPSRWAESELITHAFGQGIAVTPIQMISALGALANKGVLMKPHIIEEIRKADGTVIPTEPEKVRQVISEKSAATISAMMVSVIENGGAKRAEVKGYHIGGKTGTAQTYKNGIPLTGPGTTIASFIGFAPIDDPKFVMLVKIDRPRTTIWADATAAPLFHDIAEFLFKYYNIPPDA